MARHPFQRRSSRRDAKATPFQRALVAALARKKEEGRITSGREVSAELGRSANHLSLMLNSDFVPSGEAVLDIARVLGLDEEERDQLVRAAIETKATVRSRDRFWLTEALRFLARAEARIRELEGKKGPGGGPRKRRGPQGGGKDGD